MRKTVCLLTLAVSAMVTAMIAADRPEMSGTWAMEASHAAKTKFATLAIHQTADAIEISEEGGPDAKVKAVHLSCNTSGEQCKIKDAGEAVSFWYNGPALVMMEMRHGTDIVVKTRLEPSEDGKTLHMQVSHIAPAGKDETFTLTRQGS